MSEKTGYKVLGKLILDSGFPAMSTMYDENAEYDINDIICKVTMEHHAHAPSLKFDSALFNTNNAQNTDVKFAGNLRTSWIKELSLPYIDATNRSSKAVIKGTYPTFEQQLFKLQPVPGDLPYKLVRTDDKLDLYCGEHIAASWTSDQFPDTIIPYSFIFEIQSGGSGGAGTTYEKWVHDLDGAGGAGGGYAVGVLTFLTSDSYFLLSPSYGTAGGITSTPNLAGSSSARDSFIRAQFDSTLSDGILSENIIEQIICEGGGAANIPAHQDTYRTRYSAAGKGGQVSFYPNQVGVNYKIDKKIQNQNFLNIIYSRTGGDGGGPLDYNGRKYTGHNVIGGTAYAIADSSAAVGENKKECLTHYGKSGSIWGSNSPNSIDRGIWKGSGGGGASASADGGAHLGNDGTDGSGGGGAYWSTYLIGGSGGNGYINIYY